MLPEDLKYTKEHEWVKVEGDEAVIGVTDFAQEALGEIVYVGLPELNDSLDQFGEMGSVESTKAASDVFAPLSGEVLEVNEELNDRPELLNENPYGDGWMVRIRMSNTEELDSLLSPEDYQKVLDSEDH